MRIIIPGRPVAKRRPRFARRGKFVTTYSDQETEEGKFLLQLLQQIKTKPLENAIRVVMRFYMPIPKSTSKKRTKLMEMGEIQHIKRPDLDNLEKFVSDCLNGVAWKDDSQIVHSDTKKMYSQEPKTEIWVQECD